MKTVTSATVFHDAVGLRMSLTFSEIDETTGRVVSDNRREDFVIVDAQARSVAQAVLDFAQVHLDAEEA